MARPVLAFSALSGLDICFPQNPRAPSPDGACHASHFSWADPPIPVLQRENASLATHGDRVGNRVSADAVGRGWTPGSGTASVNSNQGPRQMTATAAVSSVGV